ncbi:hypothetical protein OGAPHI_006780 [Ogataea philodendri]|uniref:Structural protein MDM1 n=1 Tax=Ogataea philodendri TaxID=1378263 RepID=A0A9P8NW39_9ASCO|nr:uncharacterized protein OGAPHI_006780 [Ogataea philodendri]KAH3661373.1 hypothetical protein OGAPHI_006780 [Ogataea philodendri]
MSESVTSVDTKSSRLPISTKTCVIIGFVSLLAYGVRSHAYWTLLVVVFPLLIIGFLLLNPYSYTATSVGDTNKKLRSRFPRLNFTRTPNWNRELFAIEYEASYERVKRLYPENFLVSDTLHNLIELIVRDFVRSWYSRITPDERFLVELQVQITCIIERLQQRLSEMDLSEFVVYRILPIITDHYNNFIAAHDTVKNKKSAGNRSFTNTWDMDNIIASSYNKGKLHPAVKLKSVDPEDDIQRWLSQMISKILVHLVDENEIQSPPVFVLLREILQKCVFLQIVRLLSDPDFYNQLVENKLGSAMKDRLDVKKFRNALSKHSMDNLRNPRSLLSKGRLSPKSDTAKFHRVLREINRCESVADLKQYKYYVTLQLNRAARNDSPQYQTYRERLATVHNMAEKQLLYLLEPSGTLMERSKSVVANLEISLTEVLNDTAKLSIFTEFMDQRRRTPLLQLWLVVNGMRNPLDDVYDVSVEDNSEDEEEMEYSMTMAQSEDICQIYEHFFNNPLLRIDAKCYAIVSQFVQSQPPDPVLYHKARKNIFKLQEMVFERMQKTDYVAFKQSDLYLRLVAAEERHKLKSEGQESFLEDDETNGDPLADYQEQGNDDQKVSDVVLKAVEDVLNELANDGSARPGLDPTNSAFSSSEDFSEAPSGVSTPRNSRLLSKDVQRDLFGETDDGNGLFDANSEPIDEKESIKSMKLFDEDESFDEDEVTMSSSQELKLAAPENLDLGDEIDKLSTEIEKLEQQLHIIEPLLNKAEITNNVSELKILSKTQTSLKKELQLKELQKQQYILQENENTLYGNSRVRIQSYINGSDDGKEYILYIIEVQKLAADSSVIAGWMVARRFSQFFKLNNYLKNRYPEVADLDFPKRKVVMKFQQRSLIVERQRKLEQYLQSIIKIEKVCQDRVFRSFLSSELFDTNVEGSSNVLRNLGRPGKSAVNMASKLYNNISSQLQLQYKTSPVDDGQQPNLEMEKELSSLDDDMDSQAKSVSFVRPISEFLISVFWLKNSMVWLRGRAIILVLQQLLGSTIEKIVRINVEGKLKDSATVGSILTMLQDTLWPNGSFRKSGTPRTLIEKGQSKRHAKTILEFFISDTCSKVFGAACSKLAAETTFQLLQNQVLNRHLVLTILQETLEALFPEIEQ